MRDWMERQRNLIGFTLSSLFRRRGKNLALTLVYTTIVFSLGSAMFFSEAMKREGALILADTSEAIVQKMVAGRHELIPLGYAEKIVDIRGVQSVKGRLWGYYFDPVARANYTFMVSDRVTGGPDGIHIGRGMSRDRKVSRGDRLSFSDYNGQPLQFVIREIFSPESELASSDLVLVSEEGFRNLFGIPAGYATDLTVEVRNPRELTTIAFKIVQELPDTRPILKEEILRTYEAVFDWRGGLMLVILTGAVLAFIVMAWDKAAGLSAEEKREIGILKGIGWETSDILQMKFWEGLTVSLSSFLLGVLLAYGHIFFSPAGLFAPALKGWSVLYPDFRLTPFVSAYQIATLFSLTVVPYTVATIVPAWRAATIDPDTVVRT